MKISWNSTKISIGKNDLSLNSGQGETPYRLIINWDISNSLITFFKQLHRICTWKVVIKNSSSWVCFEIAVGTGRPGRGAAGLVKWHATFKVRNSSKNWILDIFNEKTLRNVKFSVLMWFLLPVCVYTLLILLNWKCFTDIWVSSSKA